MGNIRSPKELFNKKNAKDSEKSLYEKKSSIIESPKIFFGESNKNNFVSDEISTQEINIEDVITDLSIDVTILKESIIETKKYNTEINFIKKYLKNLEKGISQDEKFDPSNIYEGLSKIRKEINKVRSEIPTIPEPISYDKEFNDLSESINKVRSEIPVIPEVKYYDNQIEDLLDSLNQIKLQIEELPEVKYYDEEIVLVEDKLNQIKNSISELPEVKYYDNDLEILENKIEDVRNSIPTIPEIKYYDKQIDSLEYKCSKLKNLIDNLPELPEVKYYDEDVSALYEQIELIKKIINSLPEPKYYDKELDSICEKIEEVKNSIPEIPNIPEIKYYDEEVKILEKDISLLFKKVDSIKIPDLKVHENKIDKFCKEFYDKSFKAEQKINELEKILEEVYQAQLDQQEKIDLQEQKIEEEITNEPLENKTEDPLTPLKQEFVTFKQLRDHYRTFIQRIQVQLSTVGGGNEVTSIKHLDDVVGIATNGSAYDGKFLMYDHQTQKVIPTDTISNLKNLEDVVGIATNGAAYDGKYLRYNDSTKTFTAETIIGEAGDFTGTLTGLFDTDIANLQDGYLMIYNANASKFIWVDPQTYFGINIDANPDPLIDDYGTYS